MSKFSRVVFSSILALATVSLAMGCAEQKGAKKEDKKDDKKADKQTDAKADKQE
jgi:hypothetical protein